MSSGTFMPQYIPVDATSCFNISASAGAGSNQAFVTYLPKCVSSVFSWLPLFLAEQIDTPSVAQPRAPL
jgi:hypothetical protein